MKVRIIKRQKSGKLYDVAASRYISRVQAKALAIMFDVLIIDNHTKRDITREILETK